MIVFLKEEEKLDETIKDKQTNIVKIESLFKAGLTETECLPGFSALGKEERTSSRKVRQKKSLRQQGLAKSTKKKNKKFK